MWKGTIQLGNIEIPVKLYGAVEQQDIHFRLLHASDKTPVQQRMADPATGKEVSPDDIQRGLEIETGIFVVLKPEDLESTEPEPSRAIEVTRFVSRDTLDLSWYSRPYFLGPDKSEDDYFALAEALRDDDLRGIVRWTMRGKRYFGALEHRGGYVALIALHSAEEAVPARDLDLGDTPEIRGPERKLAEDLIKALDADFKPEEMHDEYRERVQKLIEAKAEGRKFTVKEAEAPAPTTDLAEALRRSLRTAKESRVA